MTKSQAFVVQHWVKSSLILFPLFKLLNIKANIYEQLGIILKISISFSRNISF